MFAGALTLPSKYAGAQGRERVDEYVELATPPGFQLSAPGGRAADYYTDTQRVGIGSGSAAPVTDNLLESAGITKRAPYKMEVPAPQLSVTESGYNVIGGSYRTPRSGSFAGVGLAPISPQAVSPASSTFPITSPVLGSATAQITEPIVAPALAPVQSFQSFTFGFEPPPVPRIDVPPPVTGFFGLPPALSDDPFRGKSLKAATRTKAAGRRLPVMANLFEVFEYEARTGREYRHPRGMAAEAAFSESLATGTDFFTGRKPSRSRRKKSRRFSLW
jgi:hypothetical protein